MSVLNPQIYYEDNTKHGSYAYESLENLVNNFMQIYTGNNTHLGYIKRFSVIFWMKKGIQMFSSDALREAKAVELELGETLDIIAPPDYVDYIRLSWLNTVTGALMPMSHNNKLPYATAYLQDHKGNILFDDNGYILEGDSATNALNDHANRLENQTDSSTNIGIGCNYQHYKIDTSINLNGTFIYSKELGKFHLDSTFSNKVFVLEYVSDGLNFLSDANIKVNKYAEYALYNWVYWNLLNLKNGAADYEIRRAKKDYDTAYRNAKIKLMGLRIAEVSQWIKKRNTWIK
jgi:hypothetical protein